MPGPPPKDPSTRRRRNAAPQKVQLPSEGRSGEPPAWPISGGSKPEMEAWAEVWATPQAVMWDRLGWNRTVARYVRRLVESEKRGASSALCGEVRQLEDRLGLSPMAMLRLGWEVTEDEVGGARDERPEPSSRKRLQAVDPQAAQG